MTPTGLSRFWEITCGAVGALMFAAGVWVALGGRGPQFDRQEEAVGGIIFAMFGLLCIAGSLKFRSSHTPLRRAVGGVAVRAPDRARIGGGIDVELAVTPQVDGDGLEVGLVCVHRQAVATRVATQYGRVPVPSIKEKTLSEDWQRVGPQRQFRFAIPAEAFPSSDGAADACMWRVAVRQSQRFRPDAMTVHPIWVDPAAI